VGNDLSLAEVNQAADVIRQYAHPNAQIIFGLSTDPTLESEVKLTLIATDFSDNPHVVTPDEEETPDYSSEQGRLKSFLTRK
jgi:cell division protein FtsZ